MIKHLLYLCTIGISLFLTSCIAGIERDISISAGEDAEITVEQARKFFEQELLTRNDDTPSPNILSPGDFTPQWNNAQISQNYRIACVDIPIIPRFGYRAIRSEYKLGKATAYSVRVSQKLIVVKGRESGDMAQYIMSIIPDKEFAAKHKGDISDLFLNANDRGRFSGIVLYTHHGIPVTVNKYIDGVYTGGATICGVKDDILRTQKFKQIIKSISGIRFKKCAGISSRAGEDDNWEEEEDDNWWDFDDEYIYIGGGLYVDEEGNLYIDYNNDGEIDSIYIPPVEITPEDPGDGGGGGDEPPTGEKDPPGDNGEGEYGEDNTGDGNGDDNTDEYYESLGQMGFDKIRSDLSSGDVQIKQAFLDAGKATVYAANLGTGGFNGIVASCISFMKSAQVDTYAVSFGRGMSIAGVVSGALQTIIVCTDGNITTGDTLTAISTALNAAGLIASFIPGGLIVSGVLGVTGCIIGLAGTFVTTNLPSEMHIQLEDGTNVSIYIINNQISPIVA